MFVAKFLKFPLSQNRGHNIAELDPLGILEADLSAAHPRELALSSYGLGRI